MNERDLFIQALQVEDPVRRLDLVREAASGDDSLFLRVEALLQAHAKAADFLEPPPAALAATITEPPAHEAPGATIGPYKLLEQIGEGGMGTVFMAEQQKPVRRMVALKIIKPGMDTKQVIARFEAERQALALMNHPNIARVVDVGTTSAGRPYFVMELVRGIPITDYCDQSRLSVPARLELFVQVCRAVQHAHTNGIIHRDLKPPNILVTLHDDVPIPKIIDFGIAKAIHDRLTERTLFTQFAQLVGTPLYMSPEQAQMNSLGVDTRSDVYSLGVVLYELLTGTTPFDKESLSKVGCDELRRIICEQEPPSVSARIGTLPGDQQTTISARRGVDTRELVRQTRGELDWIVVKALEKDRTRRYESASAFAADVERYLADEPVEACPPSAAYRLRKFVRRNKGALVTAAVLIVTLLAGTGVSVWQAIDATSARKLADERLVLADSRLILADERLKSEKQARHDADTQRQEANAQRQLAEANFRKARDAVDQMLTRVADEKLASIPGVEAVRKQLLEDALKFYQEFLEQRADDPELRFEVAQAWRRVGFIQDLLTNFDEARTALEHAVGIVEELSGEHHDNPQYLEFLGESYGRLSSARSLAVANAVANDEINERVLDRGLVACVHLQRLFPDKAEYCQLTAGLQFLKATLYKWTGRTTEALVLTREAIKTQRELLAEAPDNGRDATNYLACNLFLLATMVAPSNFEEADRLFAEAQTLAEAAVGRDNPDRARSGYYDDSELFLFGVLSQRAALLLGRGQIAEPEAMLRRALALMDRHIAAHPNFDAPRIGRARDRMNLANLLTETGRNDQVEALHRQARRDLDAGVAWPAASYLARYQHALLCLVTHDEAAYRAECTDMLRRFHDSQNPLELHFAAWTCALAPNAVADMDDAIALARRCVEIAPARKGFVQGLGATLFRAGRFEEALEALDRSESAKNDPVTSLVYGWYFRAMTCFRMGKADEARQWYDKAVAETTKLLTDNGTIGTEPVPWNRRLMLELLRAEASLMLGITANTGTRDAATRPNDPQPEARSGSP